MKRNQIISTAILGAASMVGMNAAIGGASILSTPHNLGAGNVLTVTPSNNPVANHSSNTGEICVFCHTPHGADNGAAVPIWNKKLGLGGDINNLTYKRYGQLGSTTFDATEAKIGSVTIACLSCHDGTQAIDNMMNAPGSGGYNAAAARLGGMTGGDLDPATGKLLTLAQGVVQNLGTDLSNDHAVSMQFGGGGVSVANPTGTLNDPDFYQPDSVNAPSTSTLGKLFYIDNKLGGGIVGKKDRWDVTFYTREDANVPGGLQPFVECGSCHDPHNADNPTFLRIANYAGKDAVKQADGRIFAGAKGGPSGLCLTCHDK